jgi:hypothetical protein
LTGPSRRPRISAAMRARLTRLFGDVLYELVEAGWRRSG